MPPPHFFDPMGFGIELLFTVVSVAFCFAIYYKTKESYELTRHKGIEYFRDAFLFFGLSYLMRFLFGLVMFSRLAFDIFLPRQLMPLFILPLGYFSTIGIFYLIFSSMWKRFNNKQLLFLGHGIAALLSILSFIARSHFILLYLQSALLILAVISGSFMQKGKHISQTKALYILVFLLWLINLLVIDGRRPFSWETELLSYAASLAVFIALYNKISKLAK